MHRERIQNVGTPEDLKEIHWKLFYEVKAQKMCDFEKMQIVDAEQFLSKQ